MKSSLFRIPVLLALTILGMSGYCFAQQLAVTEIYGGQEGKVFRNMTLPVGARILEVNIYSGERVNAVQLTYILPDGRPRSSPRYGGSGGARHTFRLDSDEYITGLSGRYDRSINSLSIQTNKRTSPVFGGRGGDREFSLELPSGNYAFAFIGRYGALLDAIGLIYLPLEFRGWGQTTMFEPTLLRSKVLSGVTPLPHTWYKLTAGPGELVIEMSVGGTGAYWSYSMSHAGFVLYDKEMHEVINESISGDLSGNGRKSKSLKLQSKQDFLLYISAGGGTYMFRFSGAIDLPPEKEER